MQLAALTQPTAGDFDVTQNERTISDAPVAYSKFLQKCSSSGLSFCNQMTIAEENRRAEGEQKSYQV